MLIVASDLHLSDRAEATPTNIARFLEAVGRTAQQGVDEGAERVALLLLGDIFEILKTRKWIDADLRPWDETTSAHEDLVQNIVATIIDANHPFFEGLARLKNDHTLELHYVAGNHDAAMGNDMGRSAVNLLDLWGFERPKGEVFRERWLDQDHAVFAFHGHQIDPYNRYTRGAAFGDAVVIEILVELTRHVAEEIGAEDGDERLRFLEEMSYVDPHSPKAMATWLLYHLRDLEEEIPKGRERLDSAIGKIADRLDELAKEVSFETDLKWWSLLLRAWRKWLWDRLDLVQWMKRLPGDPVSPVSHAKRVQREFDLFAKDDRYRFVLIGHTHHAEATPLAMTDATAATRTYLNTGTWCRSHRMTSGVAKAFQTREIETLAIVRTATECSSDRPAYELRQATVGM